MNKKYQKITKLLFNYFTDTYSSLVRLFLMFKKKILSTFFLCKMTSWGFSKKTLVSSRFTRNGKMSKISPFLRERKLSTSPFSYLNYYVQERALFWFVNESQMRSLKKTLRLYILQINF